MGSGSVSSTETDSTRPPKSPRRPSLASFTSSGSGGEKAGARPQRRRRASEVAAVSSPTSPRAGLATTEGGGEEISEADAAISGVTADLQGHALAPESAPPPAANRRTVSSSGLGRSPPEASGPAPHTVTVRHDGAEGVGAAASAAAAAASARAWAGFRLGTGGGNGGSGGRMLSSHGSEKSRGRSCSGVPFEVTACVGGRPGRCAGRASSPVPPAESRAPSPGVPITAHPSLHLTWTATSAAPPLMCSGPACPASSVLGPRAVLVIARPGPEAAELLGRACRWLRSRGVDALLEVGAHRSVLEWELAGKSSAALEPLSQSVLEDVETPGGGAIDAGVADGTLEGLSDDVLGPRGTGALLAPSSPVPPKRMLRPSTDALTVYAATGSAVVAPAATTPAGRLLAWTPEGTDGSVPCPDLVVTLGGDGTVLW